MPLTVPEFSLILLVGASGSGKSTFAAQHFLPTEVVSSDACRAWVADDEADQTASTDAFDVLHYLVAKRLRRGRLTVADATNLRASSRQPLLQLAQRFDCPVVALVFNLPESVCQERNRSRFRQLPPAVITRQCEELQRTLLQLRREPYEATHVFASPEELASVTAVERRSKKAFRQRNPNFIDLTQQGKNLPNRD